jgi:hypothetical protein
LCWIFLRQALINYLSGAGFKLWSSWSQPPEWLGLQPPVPS